MKKIIGILVIAVFLMTGCSDKKSDTAEVISDPTAHKVELDGTYNTGDLGRYATTDGKVIKKNVLIRSDSIGNITDKDIKFLESLGLDCVIDFRNPGEFGLSTDLDLLVLSKTIVNF